MAKKKTRNKQKTSNGWRVLAFLLIALIVVGFVHLKANSCTSPTHYNDLEQVNIPGNISHEIIDYEGFTVYFVPEWHIPYCTVHELTDDETDGPTPREKNFYEDVMVKGCSSLDDYKYSGFDRGHMVPAGDMKWSAKAMHDCFYLTNMVPQNGSLNSGAWNKLEQKLRDWAKRDKSLVVVTGVIVTEQDINTTIGENDVVVPGQMYKAILAPYATPMRAIAFLYPNKKAQGSLKQHAVSIDVIEQLTGIDFFYSLPDDMEESIESTCDFNRWNVVKSKKK